MATRFRLTSDTTAPAVSPAFQSYSHASGVRRRLLTTDTSALTTTAVTPDAADHLVAGDTSHVQLVSEPLGAQTFTVGDAFDLAIQALEAHAGNNLQLQVWIGIVSNDGTTALATLRSKVLDAGELATALTNKYLSSTLSGGYTTVGGERLVVEFSVSGTPTGAGGVQGHNASLRWGSNGAGGDLPENDTETGTTLNPWLEFANTITFLTTPPDDGGDGWMGVLQQGLVATALIATTVLHAAGLGNAVANAPQEERAVPAIEESYYVAPFTVPPIVRPVVFDWQDELAQLPFIGPPTGLYGQGWASSAGPPRLILVSGGDEIVPQPIPPTFVDGEEGDWFVSRSRVHELEIADSVLPSPKLAEDDWFQEIIASPVRVHELEIADSVLPSPKLVEEDWLQEVIASPVKDLRVFEDTEVLAFLPTASVAEDYWYDVTRAVRPVIFGDWFEDAGDSLPTPLPAMTSPSIGASEPPLWSGRSTTPRLVSFGGDEVIVPQPAAGNPLDDDAGAWTGLGIVVPTDVWMPVSWQYGASEGAVWGPIFEVYYHTEPQPKARVHLPLDGTDTDFVPAVAPARLSEEYDTSGHAVRKNVSVILEVAAEPDFIPVRLTEDYELLAVPPRARVYWSPEVADAEIVAPVNAALDEAGWTAPVPVVRVVTPWVFEDFNGALYVPPLSWLPFFISEATRAMLFQNESSRAMAQYLQSRSMTFTNIATRSFS